jgi:signal transduction histidine kinase
MRFAPRSLFGRLVLVLLSVLVVAQFVSFAIHMHERSEVLAQASGLQAAQRIADIVKLLDPLPPAERRRIVQAFSAPPLTISLDAGPLAVPNADVEGTARAALFGAMLRRFVGDDRPIVVGLAPGQRSSDLDVRHPMRMPGMMHPPPWMSLGSPSGPSFVAEVRLNDGSRVTFDSRQPAQTEGWPYRLLLSLAVLLAAVLAVSLVAVRWATRPLAVLADAADALGKNIDQPPIPERGPTEVVRAARAFNTMQKRLAAYLRERTATVAAISHDLKTPVTRLRLRAELLDDGELKAKVERDLDEMQSMLHSALAFMRGVESEEKPQPVDMTALLESLQADAQELGGRVAIEGHAQYPYVGRPQALKRCLRNLVDNALKYGKSATLLVQDSPAQLVVRVRDEGPGIPHAELERVFEPFYRMEASRSRDTGGTGLGLSIAKSIAELHQGTLGLHNLPGGGLEAVLTLPRR